LGRCSATNDQQRTSDRPCHTYDSLGEPLELHNVGREHGPPVAFDEVEVVADHPEAVCDDVHGLLAGDRDRKLGVFLHVILSSEPRADDEDMKAVHDALELGPDVRLLPVQYVNTIYAWPRGLTYASSRRIGCTIRSGAYVFIAFPAVGEQIACARSTPCDIALDDWFVLLDIVLTRRIDDMDAKNGAPV
jgi:hypothetical protein